MSNEDFIREIKRLKFEDFLWVVFIVLALLNIYGDHNDVDYLETGERKFKQTSNKIFEATITISILIYIYFFVRNFNAYEKSSEKDKKLFAIKLLGSSLLIAGALCLLYFQKKQTSFTGTPAL